MSRHFTMPFMPEYSVLHSLLRHYSILQHLFRLHPHHFASPAMLWMSLEIAPAAVLRSPIAFCACPIGLDQLHTSAARFVWVICSSTPVFSVSIAQVLLQTVPYAGIKLFAFNVWPRRIYSSPTYRAAFFAQLLLQTVPSVPTNPFAFNVWPHHTYFSPTYQAAFSAHQCFRTAVSAPKPGAQSASQVLFTYRSQQSANASWGLCSTAPVTPYLAVLIFTSAIRGTKHA